MTIWGRGQRPAARRRLEEAVIDVTVINGTGAEVATVCRRAETSLFEFREQFADLEDAVFQVFLRCRDEMLPRLLQAYATQDSWREQMRRVQWAMLDFFEEDRRRGRFMAVDAITCSDRVSVAIDELTAVMVELIDRGRDELDDPERLSRTTAEAVAGGVSQQIQAALASDLLDGLALGQRLMYTVVAPYLGVAAASDELTKGRTV
jgi:AcrR family transcriptional regulator